VRDDRSRFSHRGFTPSVTALPAHILIRRNANVQSMDSSYGVFAEVMS
jgi:hypothetical protein